MKVIMDEKLVAELADAAHDFRMWYQENRTADDRRAIKARQGIRTAEHRLRLAILAIHGIDEDWSN